MTRDRGDKFISKCLVKKAKSEVDKAKNNYHKNLAEEQGPNKRKFWDDISDIEPLLNATINGIKDENTGEIIPEEELPERINNFFINIGAKLASRTKIIPLEDKVYIPKLNPVKYDIKVFDSCDIINKLNTTDTRKSSGMENISTDYLIRSMGILIREITHLYSTIIKTGIYPQEWKIAIVTPIPKISHPQKCGDLRPISILPLPGRIFEKLASDQMTKHLEDSGYFADQQCGFRKKRSTTKSLITLLDEIIEGMNEGDVAVTIFFDLQKAFDTVDHKLLIWKLERAGFGENTCNLMANYLSNRKQATKYNNITSDTPTIRTGVPQGSTLGPLKFIIFFNDFPDVFESLLCTAFADDATATARAKSTELARDKISIGLKASDRWCRENRMTVNTAKTEYMIFGTRQKLAKENKIQLTLGNQQLKEAETYKYLGTTLDPTLNGSQQLKKLNQQLAIKLNTFRKIRRSMSENTAIIIFNATIVPIFDYNDVFYYQLTKQQLIKLQRLQNRALRLVFSGRVLSVQEMHERAGIGMLNDRRELHLLALMYDRAHDIKYVDTTNRVTRRADAIILKTPQINLTKAAKAPKYMGSIAWNNLPVKLRQADTKTKFIRNLKIHRTGLPMSNSTVATENRNEKDPDNSLIIII